MPFIKTASRNTPTWSHLHVPGLVLLLLLATGLTSCESEEPTLGVTLSEVADDPEEYYGDLVTVSGEIDEVLGPTIFTIGGDDFDDELLVVSADPVPTVPGRTAEEPFAEGDIVQVTGVVQPFVREELDLEYGLDLPQALDIEYENDPVIVAASSASVLSGILVTPRTATPPAEVASITDVSTIARAADTSQLAGRTAAFADVQVLDTLGAASFWVGEDPTERLFVVLSDPALADTTIDIVPGQRWALSGVLQPVPEPALIRSEWQLGEEAVAALQEEAVYLQALQARRLSDAASDTVETATQSL